MTTKGGCIDFLFLAPIPHQAEESATALIAFRTVFLLSLQHVCSLYIVQYKNSVCHLLKYIGHNNFYDIIIWENHFELFDLTPKIHGEPLTMAKETLSLGN